MKMKIFSLLVTTGLLLAACAPAAASEPAPALVEQVTVEVVEAAPTAMAPAEVSTAKIAVDEVSFSKDIWPVIEKFALAAHGGKGGVFLESYADIMKYVVPGSPKESELYKRLTADGVPLMPPSGPLPAETVQFFYDWIMQGAKNN